MFSKILIKIKEEKLLITSWVVLVLSILTTYANYTEIKDEIQVASLFTSDTLGMPSLYKDLFIDKGHFKDWVFASAPTLFPDIFLYFFIVKVFSLNFLSAALVYGFIQVCSITFLCVYIYKKLVPENYVPYKWLVPLFFAMIFMESFYFSNDLFFGFMLLSYSFHTGSFLNCLICISVFISPLSKISKYVFLLLFSAVAVFSDKLFIIMLIIPLILTLGITCKRTKDYKHILIAIFLMIIGTLLAFKFYDYINKNKFATFQLPHKMYAYDNIIPSIKIFFEQLFYYCSIPGFKSCGILFTFLSIPFVLFYLFKHFKSQNKNILILSCFYFFFVVCVFSAPLVNGNYSGWDTLRYNIYPFFFSSVAFALCIAVLFKGRSDARSKNISMMVVLAFLILVSVKFSPTGFVTYLNFYPKKVAEIDSVASKYNLKRGIADYWIAKKVTMFSKNNVKIVSVYENTSIQELGANINWFFDKEFDFIVANKMAPANVLQRCHIRDTIETANYQILIVDHFTYPKGNYFPEKLTH